MRIRLPALLLLIIGLIGAAQELSRPTDREHIAGVVKRKDPTSSGSRTGC